MRPCVAISAPRCTDSERAWTDPDYVPPASYINDVTAVDRQLELLGSSQSKECTNGSL